MQLRCPTCRALWREVALCGRCGTDLSVLIQIALRAWKLREAARQLICEGTQPVEAVRLARAAYQLHATAQARKLLVMALLANQQIAEAREVIRSLSENQEPISGDNTREVDR